MIPRVRFLFPLWGRCAGSLPCAQGGFDLELAQALLDVSVVPMMITLIMDPVVDSMVSPAAYPEPPLPVVLVDFPVPVAESSPLQGVADSPVRECSPSFQASPVGSGYGPIPSPMSPSSQITDGHGLPPVWLRWTYHEWVLRLGGWSSDSPLLPRHLTPQPLVEVMVVESTVHCSTEEPVAVSPPSMPDLSRVGPFDVHQVTTELGASPRVLDSLPGCQYRMTLYDVANDPSL